MSFGWLISKLTPEEYISQQFNTQESSHTLEIGSISLICKYLSVSSAFVCLIAQAELSKISTGRHELTTVESKLSLSLSQIFHLPCLNSDVCDHPAGNFSTDRGLMSIEFEDVNDGLRRIKLSGRLDIAGTEAISMKFTNLAASAARRVVVDLSAVSFLASIGIRELITSAKAQQQRGGRVVLFVGDNALVAKTLEVTGIDALIPMFANAAEADQAALA
jgi:anti-anti-sigma factor